MTPDLEAGTVNELVDQCSLGAELSPEQALAVADALVQAATADVDGGQS